MGLGFNRSFVLHYSYKVRSAVYYTIVGSSSSYSSLINDAADNRLAQASPTDTGQDRALGQVRAAAVGRRVKFLRKAIIQKKKFLFKGGW